MISDKEQIKEKKQILIDMISGFCDEHLNEAYKEICIKLVGKMSRKREVPFLNGRIDIWAAAVVYSIGQINFLFDRSSEPYVTRDDICKYFKTNKTTTTQRAKKIRDLFKLGYLSREFTISSPISFDGLVGLGGLFSDC